MRARARETSELTPLPTEGYSEAMWGVHVTSRCVRVQTPARSKRAPEAHPHPAEYFCGT